MRFHLEILARDCSYAARLFLKSPGFAVVAFVLLAIGIGSNTAIFSVVEAVLIRPLPYRDPSRICMVWKSIPAKGLDWDWTSEPMIRDWRNRSRSFEDIAFVLRPEGSQVTVTGPSREGGPPEIIQASKVSGNLFQLLGVLPMIGRAFSDTEIQRGENLAVLSYGFWQRRFGGANDIAGRTLEIDHRAATIIGVMQPSFQFPDKETQIWLPITADQRWPLFQVKRVADAFSAVGRLRPGVSLEQARADASRVEAELAIEYPVTDAGLGVRIVPLPEQVAGPQVRRSLLLLLGGVVSVLLITCANVAGLLLARGAARQRELAVRAALGATRRRLIRQLLTESVLLTTVGGLAGILLAVLVTPALVASAPSDLPRLDQVHIDTGVLIFTVLVSMVTGIACGIVPAWYAARRDPGQAVNDGGRGGSAGVAASRTRGLLIAAEYAVAVLLLAGTVFQVRSFLWLREVALGFDQNNLLLMKVRLPNEKYGDTARCAAFFEEAIKRIDAIPGVRGAAAGSLFTRHLPNTSLVARGDSRVEDTEPNGYQYITPEYFRVAGIPLLKGRTFSGSDSLNSPAVAIINEAMASRLWPGESPLGKQFKQTMPGLEGDWLTVVGVAADVLSNGRESKTLPSFYRPLRQIAWSEMGIVVRTSIDAVALAPAIRQTALSIDPAVPDFEVTTARERLAELEAPRRFETSLLAMFGAAALLLAATGLCGSLYYAVEQRTKEIGIRVALGAETRQVIALIVSQGLRWVAIGLGIGASAALVFGKLVSGVLSGIGGANSSAFAIAVGVLIAFAIVAAIIPARRAAGLDPLACLRRE